MPPTAKKDKYALTSWGEDLPDLEMPSGQIAQVRRPGIKNLIKLGILDSADPLLGVVDAKHIKRVQGQKSIPDLDVSDLINNPEALTRVMNSIDKIVMYVVVQPRIQPVPLDDDGQEIPIDQRTPGVGYVDLIDDEDKMYLFNYAVGGSADLTTFRGKLGEHVDALAAKPGVSLPTKRSPRVKSSG